jgi:hypothetical protein
MHLNRAYEIIDETNKFPPQEKSVPIPSSHRFVLQERVSAPSYDLPELDHTERIEVKAQLKMCVHSIRHYLSHSLDPTFYKRYQRSIVVGCLSPEVFYRYFGTLRGSKPVKRFEENYYWRQVKRVPCLAFEYKGFENLPQLGCHKSYAFRSRHVIQQYWSNNVVQQYSLLQREETYRIYFSRLVFILNPESWILKIDFDMKFEVLNKDSNEFEDA